MYSDRKNADIRKKIMRCINVSEMQNPYVDNKDAKITFIDVILGFMQMDNADVYVTGGNSKMLSSDILTQFRDRGMKIY